MISLALAPAAELSQTQTRRARPKGIRRAVLAQLDTVTNAFACQRSADPSSVATPCLVVIQLVSIKLLP